MFCTRGGTRTTNPSSTTWRRLVAGARGTSGPAAVLCVSMLAPHSALAELTYEGEQGSLTFQGDVELDISAYNAQSSESGSLFLGGDIDHDDRYDQTGRVLLDVSGDRVGDGYRAHFKVQPLLGTNGLPWVDDAWLAISNQEGSEIKVGRFEAFDLFPLGQDVFVEMNGDTSNSLYRDGQGYVYQAKEGRGRGSSAGQLLLSHESGDLYAEVSTLIGDRSSFFDTDTYHGFSIADDTKNSAIVRPVIAWTPGSWTMAVGAETNLISDAVVDERGEDIGDRTGYAYRLSYSAGELQVNLNLAYLDAYKETDATFGLNTVWHNVGLGYIHARNEIEEANPSAVDEDFTPEGTYRSHTFYTSYRFAEVLGIQGFDTYLGAFYSSMSNSEVDDMSDEDRYGARLRLKFFF